MFEDDFAAAPRPRTASIAEEEEGDLPPLRPRPPPTNNRDIRKSDSINIFTRESDPFEGDAFFACTGSDRAARRENWPGDFQGFDNAWGREVRFLQDLPTTRSGIVGKGVIAKTGKKTIYYSFYIRESQKQPSQEQPESHSEWNYLPSIVIIDSSQF